MKKTVFIKNAAVLSASSIILRFAGIVFKVWLAARIGTEGMGLYQLTLSLFLLASAFTQSGIPTAVTRLVAGESALGNSKGIKRIMSAAFAAILILSAITALILYFGADAIAYTVISDKRAALSVKLLALSVFFIGVSSVIRGYFIARRKVSPGAFSQLLEQFIRISAVIAALKIAAPKGLGAACAAVFSGDVIAGAFSCGYLFLRYRYDVKRVSGEGKPFEKHPLKRTIEISLPLTAGRYLNSLLRTAENMLVIRALTKHGEKGALSLFGMIKGMALPVLFFPSVVLNAVSTLLVPEMSEAAGMHKSPLVRSAVEQVLSGAAAIGFIFSAVFAAGGRKLGVLLYKSADVGFLLAALAPIVPFMYADSLCDGLLKGLNQQKFTFRVSVADSALRLVAVFPMLSFFGIKGFIGIMYFSNFFTAFLNVRRLIKISGAALSWRKTVFVPALSAFTATLIIKALLDIFALADLVYIIFLSSVSLAAYILLVSYFGCINLNSFLRIRTHKKYAAATTKTSLIK